MQCDYDQDLSNLIEYVTEEDVQCFKQKFSNVAENFDFKNQNIIASYNSRKRILQLNDEIDQNISAKKTCIKINLITDKQNSDVEYLFSKNECIVID